MTEETKLELYFEAIYIYLTYIFEKENINIKQTGLKAIERILKVCPWKTIQEMENFIQLNKTARLVSQGEELYRKLEKDHTGSFFDLLSEDELALYYSANLEVSKIYGQSLAKVIDFSGKKILDMGGAAGGLAIGIKSVYENSEISIFDTKIATETGIELCSFYGFDIRFYSGNFFESININADFDYIVFSNVFHDWNDESLSLIIRNLSPLIKKGQKLIIHEDMVLDEEVPEEETVLFGLRLCANVPEGVQRTPDELKMILDKNLPIQSKIEKIYNYGAHSAMIVQFV